MPIPNFHLFFYQSDCFDEKQQVETRLVQIGCKFNNYRKVESPNTSRLGAYAGF